MKPYLAPNRVPLLGMVLLICGSVLLGIVIGTISYLVSNLIYMMFVFSIVVGGVTMICFGLFAQLTKVRHSAITALMGFATGLFVAIAFYGSPYYTIRREFISNAEQNYQVSAQEASDAFNEILVEETGSSGFLGFMKLQAKEGDQYTNHIEINGILLPEFTLSVNSIWAWLYWLIEILFFSAPAAYMGYQTGNGAFSESANNWYGLSNEVGVVPFECKDRVLFHLNGGHLLEISELVGTEKQIRYPLIEIYEQHSYNNKGDILLSLKHAYYEKAYISRSLLGQWEVSEELYQSFLHMVKVNKISSQSGKS